MSVQSPQGYTPPPAPPTTKKKGLGPLGWVLIGCGALALLALVGFGVIGYIAKNKLQKYGADFEKNPEMAAAKIIVAANPDLEMVSADDNAKTLTIRNKKTNEVMTANLDDIKNGRFKFTGPKGSGSFDVSGKDGSATIKVTDDKGKESTTSFGAGVPKDLPSWVPSYPGGAPQGSYSSTTPEGRAGGFTVALGDPPDKVIDWYEAQLKSAGFAAQKSTVATNGATNGGSVTATSSDQKRTVNVAVSTQDKAPGSQVMITYNEKS